MTTQEQAHKPQHRVKVLPETPYGRWAVGLAAACVLLTFAWSMLPGGALLGFASGIAGGIVALVAIFRHKERSISVFAALVPLAFVVFFLVAEILSIVGILPPH